MHAAILCAAFYLAQFLAPAAGIPLVEQTVDFVSVAHLGDGTNLLFFFAPVQGEITCLDHRWLASDMAVHRAGDEWVLSWTDESRACYRVIRARHWLESWEATSPLAEMNARPWFRQACAPGLAQPQRAER